MLEYRIDPDGEYVFCDDVSPERRAFILAAMRGEVMLTPEDVCAAIDRERDRRVHTRFQFNGVWYQCQEQDVVNITGAGATALASLVAGTPWPAGFVWIAEDNSRVPMTAAEVIGLGNAYTAFRSALIFCASDMKARVRAGGTVDHLSDAAWEP